MRVLKSCGMIMIEYTLICIDETYGDHRLLLRFIAHNTASQ